MVNAESCRNSDCQFSSVDCQNAAQNPSDQKTAFSPWSEATPT
jgi:hypothetical protein